MNGLTGCVALTICVSLAINTPQALGQETLPAVAVMVTMSWAEGSADDIDLLVKDPDLQVTWYKAPKHQFVELLHDAYAEKPTHHNTPPYNEEQVAIHPGRAGEYIVNVDARESPWHDVPVRVRVEEIVPEQLMIYDDTTDLNRLDERTAVRFTLREDGSVGNINDTQTRFHELDKMRSPEAPAFVRGPSRAYEISKTPQWVFEFGVWE